MKINNNVEKISLILLICSSILILGEAVKEFV